MQHGSQNGPIGVHYGRTAHADEPQYISQPSFGEHGSRNRPIELDDLEEELDEALEFAADPPALGSQQPIWVNSNIGTTRRGTVPVTRNVGISAPSASGPSFQQSLQPGEASGGPMYSQQLQPTAATRRSDAELAKHNAEKKSNKAEEIGFEKHGRWWHRLNVNEDAGMDIPLSDRRFKTNI